MPRGTGVNSAAQGDVILEENKYSQNNIPQQEGDENNGAGNTRKSNIRGLLIAMCVCLGVAVAFLVPAVVWENGPMLLLAVAAAIAGIIILAVIIARRVRARGTRGTHNLTLPVTALVLSLLWAPLLGLGTLFLFVGFGIVDFIALIMYLAMPITAVVGVVLGIVCLTVCKSKIGRLGKALAALAIVIPPVTVIVVIALLSSGVIIIALM